MKKHSSLILLFIMVLTIKVSDPAKITHPLAKYKSETQTNESYNINVLNSINTVKSYASELNYSTFLGGEDTDEGAYLTIDQEQNIWITGTTTSVNFPTTPNAYNQTHSGSFDIFVTKFDGQNGSMIYSTYIGGTGYEIPHSIVVDVNQDVWICGETGSVNFPTTSNAYDSVLNGSVDAFLFKLSGINGSLLYSSYIGGTGGEAATAMAFDSLMNLWFIGMTLSDDFPTTPLAPYPVFNGSIDAFLTRFTTNGSSLEYSTFLGGSDADYSYSLAFTPSDEIWMTGQTSSLDFPVSLDANDSSLTGSNDIFLTRFAANGTNVIYSTYIGGSSSDSPGAITVDQNGDLWMTGQTQSSNFPTTLDAYDTTYGGSYDAFLLKFAGNESKYLYSTYFGGGDQDYARSIDVDKFGNIWISGETGSDLFPTTPNAYNSTFSGVRDAFILVLAPNQTLLYSTFIGGSDIEAFTELALDPRGKVWIVGETQSVNFPTTPNAYNGTKGTSKDVFLFSLIVFSPPQAPTELMIYETSEGNAILTWEKPLFDGNTPISKYRIYRNTSLIFDNYLSETPLEYFVDETVLSETTYYYSISAMNNFGESELTDWVTFIVILPIEEPGPPENLLGFNETNSIYLTWNIPLIDGGTPIRNYSLYRREMCGTYSLLDSTIDTFYNDTSIYEGITYMYVVTAVNVKGEGTISNEVVGKVIDTTSPVISSPADIFYIQGSINHVITWNVSDNNPSRFIITRNGVLIISTSWDGSDISISVDDLTIGPHSFNCTVIDQIGNSAYDLVTVQVSSVTDSATITTIPITTTSLSTTDPTPGFILPFIVTFFFLKVVFRKKRRTKL
ncbi:MAG: SBBP repeat-containing protein [Candidatus Hodarchaeales archaeon]